MNKQEQLVLDQLSKVCYADLSNYNEEENSYFIPKINNIKIQLNHTYIIEIKESIKNNQVLKCNYNKGEIPPFKYCLMDVLLVLGKIIKINGVEYDLKNKKPLNNIWSGFLNINDIKVLEEVE